MPVFKQKILENFCMNSSINSFRNFIHKYLKVSYEGSIYGDVNIERVTDYLKYDYGHRNKKTDDNTHIQ